jgi:hypothetical protein
VSALQPPRRGGGLNLAPSILVRSPGAPVGCAGALSFGPGLAPPPPQSGEPAWPADRAAAGLSRLRSSIGDALAEPPTVLGPLSLEPRLALAPHKLGDDVGLVVVAVSLTRKRSMLPIARRCSGRGSNSGPRIGLLSLLLIRISGSSLSPLTSPVGLPAHIRTGSGSLPRKPWTSTRFQR